MAWLFENFGILYACGCIVLGLLCLFVIFPIQLVREKQKASARVEAEKDEPPLEEIHGRVVEKHCYSGVGVGKSGKAYTCFYFLFLTDGGETIRYEIDEETYHTIEEQTEGTVGLVGTRFYGFCPDDTENSKN